MKKELYFKKEDAKKFNQLAREQMKLKLLADINVDLTICKIEGWDVKEYLSDLKKMITQLTNKIISD